MSSKMPFAAVVAVVLIGSAFTFAAEPVVAAQSRSGFCAYWKAVCMRTLRPGDQPSVCATRLSGCLSSGCYFFNNPRPRCENNTFDTDLMRPQNRGKGCPDCR
jgi:hypothetical protein